MNQITRTAPAQRAMHCPTKHSVQRQPIVAGASLNLASTADEDGLLEFSVTIVLQSAGEGEG